MSSSKLSFFSKRIGFGSANKLKKARLENQYLEDELVQTRRLHEQEEHRRRVEREDAQRQEDQRRHKEKERYRIECERIAAEKRVEDARLHRLKKASPDTLRTLRELIRNRYELDVKIWGLRHVRKPDQPIVQAKMDKADAIMDEILGMVEVWADNNNGDWTAEEWDKVQIIQRRLREGGYRVWANNPPWADRAY